MPQNSNFRRVSIFIAVAVIASTVFTPRLGREYHFLFESFGRLDVQQLILNVFVAAILGFLLAHIPDRILMILLLVAAMAIGLFIAVILHHDSVIQETRVQRHPQLDFRPETATPIPTKR